MNKKIFKLSFLFLAVFVFGSFIASTALAARKASVTISPTTAFTEENITYTYTVTNADDEETTAKIGSIEIEVPNEFGIPSVSILSTSSGKTWILDSSEEDYGIRVKASGADNKLDIGEFIEIQVVTTAPAAQDLYEWTTVVWANLDFSGDPVFELTSEQPSVEVTEPPTVTFIIRSGDSVLYNDSVALPASGTVSISDSNDVPHDVDSQSVLAILKAIDDASDAFLISNLQYYDSFGAFYLKCILPDEGEDLCDNWQYAVGNVTPFSGIDATILSGGETVGVYFGNSHQLVLSANTITAGESLTATAEKYDYENNTWNPLTDVSVGVTLPNPDNPFDPIVVSTHPVDDLGNANITITDANTYTLGIVEDFYFPSYTVTVKTIPSGGGGGGGYTPPSFDVQDALTYLKSVQSDDGSFSGSLMYTDWAAIAFGALNVADSYRDNILAYFNSNNAISPTLTDNERRAMALLALGQNPYSFNDVNYIYAITSSFDGAQFGDFNLVNDDIFALIPLANSGYTASDDIIIKNVAFIISKQNTNGSWEGNVDLTAAAIQALNPFESVAGVSSAIDKAIIYLQNAQGSDGGWGNIYSTSWAMQAESALGISWSNNGKAGLDYLATQQTNANNNGALFPSSATLQNNIWATSYAIAAASGKSWSEIMQSVSKPVAQNNSSADAAENTNPQTPASPVVCPKGDLFSATTGQACTTTALIDSTSSINSVQANSESTATQTPDTILSNNETNLIAANGIASSDLSANIDTPEIIPDTLTATAVKTLPTKTIPHIVPIVLGALLGLALFYLVFKFSVFS